MQRRRSFRTLALAGFLFAIGFVPGAAAQISPGPLARPHKFLNGTTNCTSCHKLGSGEATFKCADCHTEIGARLAAHRGYHPRAVQKPGSQDCARCHSDHNGEDFQLLHWDPRTFDHSQTGYKLEGKHSGPACTKCHTPDRISPAERQTIKMKDLSRTYLGLSQACTTCHEDYHKGQLGPNCITCHNFEDWKKTSEKFDHSKTRYPLTGQHAQVACQKCHTAGDDGKPRFKGLPFDRCSVCHNDPHKGSFTATCQTCHNTSGWKRVAASTLGQQFDHSKTKFALQGKHAEVECGKCHQNGDFKKPLVFAKCSDCHKPDPHNGQFAKRPDAGECSACHTVDGWKPSKFTIKEHAGTQYPLLEKHAQVDCAKCHIPAGKDTIFKLKFAKCMDCHKDMHGGQFASAPHLNKCDECHNIKGFKPALFSLTQHKETRFSLTGGHLAIPCAECHKPTPDEEPRQAVLYHWDPLDCTSCHQNPHKEQFRDRMSKVVNGKMLGCEACHGTKAWRDLTRFDHATTKFQLVGAHRAVDCAGCHKPPNLETKLLNVDFHSAPTVCEECHQDPHGEQFVNAKRATPCADCHNTTKWRPSLFDHDRRTQFSLQGAHRNVRCRDCHKSKREVDGKEVLFYKPTPKECEACHGPEITKPKTKS